MSIKPWMRCLALLQTLQTSCALWPQSAQGIQGSPSATALAATPASRPATAWWREWGDDTLNSLQARLLAKNPGVQIANAKVQQAQAALQATEANLWPTLQLQSQATRAQTGPAAASNHMSFSLPMSWEIDVWGRLNDARRASQARLIASEADLAMARLSAQATLVQLYVQIRASERQLSVLDASHDAQQRALALTQARLEAGVASEQDLIQARLQLQNTQTQRLELGSTHSQLVHALWVLVGEPPAAAPWVRTGQLPQVPTLPPVVWTQVLEHRPDVASAQAQVQAAQASVGAAQKAVFPTVSFNAAAGYQSADLAQLWSNPARLWSLGGSLALNLVDGGAKRAASAQAQAALTQAAASYQQVVLTALQEVQDNLVLVANLSEQVRLRDQALVSAQRNLQISQSQYQVGVVSYLNVILAQTSALSAELAAVSDRAKWLQAHNQLLKNLMGNAPSAVPEIVSGIASGAAPEQRPHPSPQQK